jgi:hypothetical protein
VVIGDAQVGVGVVWRIRQGRQLDESTPIEQVS